MIEDADTLDGANALELDGLCAEVSGLSAVVVFLRDLSHELAHWSSARAPLSSSRLAAIARPVLHAAADAASTLSSGPGAASSATIELGERVLFVEEAAGFGIALLFDRATPLGLARLAARRLVEALESELARSVRAPRVRIAVSSASPGSTGGSDVPAPRPSSAAARTPTGDRVRALLAALGDACAEPHLVSTRLGLRSGLGASLLASPDALSSEALRIVESAARELLAEVGVTGSDEAQGAST